MRTNEGTTERKDVFLISQELKSTACESIYCVGLKELNISWDTDK